MMFALSSPKAEYISYAAVFVFAAGGFAVVAGHVLLSSLIRPKVDRKAKRIAYECGEEPVGNAWFKFNIRFYVVALVFIIFDVELALMFPIASIYKRFMDWAKIGHESLALVLFAEMFLFVFILFTGLVYIWVKGDLSWVRPEMKERMARYREMRRTARQDRTPSAGGGS